MNVIAPLRGGMLRPGRDALRVLAASADDGAALVAADTVVGRHTDLAALLRFAEGCDVVTFDHEHVPGEHIRALVAHGHTVYPGADALRHAQDKRAMRTRLQELGVPMPDWRPVTDPADAAEFVKAHGPAVVKAATGGYDGRGVWSVDGPEQARSSFDGIDGPLLAEARIAFTHELAVMVVRGDDGDTRTYPPFETIQVDGQCHEVFTPASVSADDEREARRLAVAIAGLVDLVGVMAVELFVTPDGLLLNELAVRPHNSGHLTIEAARSSQFDQQVRALCGLPLGDCSLSSPAAMVNLLGDLWADGEPRWEQAMRDDPGVKLHLYGKRTAKPGRKMGHFTRVMP